MVVLYQSLDEKTRVCRRSASGTQGADGSGHLSRAARYRVRLSGQHQRGGAEGGQDHSGRDTGASRRGTATKATTTHTSQHYIPICNSRSTCWRLEVLFVSSLKMRYAILILILKIKKAEPLYNRCYQARLPQRRNRNFTFI